MLAVSPDKPALCVDLDGTLLATDLLHESFVAALKRAPWVVMQCAGWLAAGGRPRLLHVRSAAAGRSRTVAHLTHGLADVLDLGIELHERHVLLV